MDSFNSYTRQIAASLNYYGLIDIKGMGDDRRFSISDDAYRIIENAPDKGDLIRNAVLMPNVFNKVWAHYKDSGLPNDDVLSDELVWGNKFHFKFTKKGAKTFIENLRSSLKFANIDTGDILESETEVNEGEEMPEHEIPESSPQNQPHQKPPSPQISDAMRTYNIPVSSTKDATLLIQGSITVDEYGFIQEWLKIMKNAIVEHENVGKRVKDNEADDTANND